MDIKIAFLTLCSVSYDEGFHRSSNGWVRSVCYEARCIGLYVDRNDCIFTLQGYEAIKNIYETERLENTKYYYDVDHDDNGNSESSIICSQGKHNDLTERLNKSILSHYGFHFIACDNSSELKHNLFEFAQKPFKDFYNKWYERERMITKQISEIDANIKQLESKMTWLEENRNSECVQNCSHQICSLINQGLIDINSWLFSKNKSLLDIAIQNEDKFLIDTIYKYERKPITKKTDPVYLQDSLLENKSWLGFFSNYVYGVLPFLGHWDNFVTALPLLSDEFILNFFSNSPQAMEYENIIISSTKIKELKKSLDDFLNSSIYYTEELAAFETSLNQIISDLEASGRKHVAECLQEVKSYYF